MLYTPTSALHPKPHPPKQPPLSPPTFSMLPFNSRIPSYLDKLAIKYAIELVTIENDTDEGPVQTAWTNICRHIFDTYDYLIETNHRWNTQFPDVIVVGIRGFSTGISGVDLLVVECKRQQENARDTHFDDWASSQLSDQLVESINGSHIFGAVAIGNKVKFYRLNAGKSKAKSISTILSISEHADEVDLRLEMMKMERSRLGS
ncbi:hypothetical protein K440DRAFT_661717 [Wilcoxina mikolae CBS 423.85]|nr:hypothetical protein K440DRAFT_661717 [Wilcoxina mikolae CBS 423.85]